MSELIIAPSLLSANSSNFAEAIISLRNLGCKWLHYDIMDGHFVPNLSFGPQVVKDLSLYGLYNDVHLMITDPVKYASKFIQAGADNITIHYEAIKDPILVQQQIRSMSKKPISVGLSIKPRTRIEDILDYVNYFDVILIMSVEPGFSGQEFLPNALYKIEVLRKYIDKHHLSTLIEVDGGINDTNIQQVKQKGADVVVSGKYLMTNDHPDQAIKYMLEC